MRKDLSAEWPAASRRGVPVPLPKEWPGVTVPRSPVAARSPQPAGPVPPLLGRLKSGDLAGRGSPAGFGDRLPVRRRSRFVRRAQWRRQTRCAHRKPAPGTARRARWSGSGGTCGGGKGMPGGLMGQARRPMRPHEFRRECPASPLGPFPGPTILPAAQSVPHCDPMVPLVLDGSAHRGG